jgi:hypothetical protein
MGILLSLMFMGELPSWFPRLFMLLSLASYASWKDIAELKNWMDSTGYFDGTSRFGESMFRFRFVFLCGFGLRRIAWRTVMWDRNLGFYLARHGQRDKYSTTSHQNSNHI